MLDMPYFMENPDWFYFDFANKTWKLTDAVPEKAKESYKDYISALKEEH